MNRHGQRTNQVRAARLLAIARAVLPAQLAAPATSGAPKSVPGNSEFSSNAPPKTAHDAPGMMVGSNILPPGAATSPGTVVKSP